MLVMSIYLSSLRCGWKLQMGACFRLGMDDRMNQSMTFEGRIDYIDSMEALKINEKHRNIFLW